MSGLSLPVPECRQHRSVTATAQSVATPRSGAGASSARGLLAILLTGQFMAILDTAIVNIAAPSVRNDLGASGAALQLIVAGYTIAYAVLLITGARVGARWGHRRTYLL